MIKYHPIAQLVVDDFTPLGRIESIGPGCDCGAGSLEQCPYRKLYATRAMDLRSAHAFIGPALSTTPR